MDMSQYKDLFISETREHLRAMNATIVALEQESGEKENIDALFRLAHSVKGMAASMGYEEIAELAHRMEDLMDQVRKGAFPFGTGVADLLLEGADLLDAMVNAVEKGSAPPDIGGLLQRLTAYRPQASEKPSPSLFEEPEPAREGGGEEKNLPEPPGGEGKAAGERRAHRTVRIKTDLLDRLINLTGELITTKERLRSTGSALGSAKLEAAVEELAGLLRELHNEVQNVRLLPFAGISERFPRVVRDLAKKSGKEVSFAVEGKETALDRGILEELSDPLVHILRNAVDHGIETPEERVAVGKERSGRIRLAARREKDQVIVTAEDDGRGMDPARLTAAAVAKGLITPEKGERLTPDEALMLTCIPGFSTAEEVTDLSGRGVGMDAVHAAIKSVGGTLAIQSEPGRGSRIILKLPPTIAIVHIFLVSCADLTLGIPITNILRILELDRTRIVGRGKRRFFLLEEEEIPLLSLNRILGLPGRRPPGKTVPTLLAEMGGRRVGLVVDRFLGQQEVYIKPLGRPLARLKGVASGAILGSGEAIFVLDVANLL